jgi:hypothetical protein
LDARTHGHGLDVDDDHGAAVEVKDATDYYGSTSSNTVRQDSDRQANRRPPGKESEKLRARKGFLGAASKGIRRTIAALYSGTFPAYAVNPTSTGVGDKCGARGVSRFVAHGGQLLENHSLVPLPIVLARACVSAYRHTPLCIHTSSHRLHSSPSPPCRGLSRRRPAARARRTP